MATTLDLLRWGLSPPALFRSLVGEPDPWQVSFLESRAPRVLMLCHRQSGKSSCAAVAALHTAMFTPDATVIIVSPTQRQSGLLFSKVCRSYADLGQPLGATVENAVTLTMGNGSQVVSLPGDPRTIRGYSAPALVLVDEAAMADDGVFIAVSPMLAVAPRARMAWLSTPLGQRGEFWRQWEEGGSEWERYKVTAHDCPRIDRGWLESERRRLGPLDFGQEFLCEFRAAVGQVFDSESIAALMDTDEQPLFALGG
jgi:hypothetical protein